jgi:hypothetical protein
MSRTYRRPFLALGLLLAAAAAARADGEGLDSLMYRSPDLPGPKVVPAFPDGLKPAWLEALKRPDDEYKVRVPQTIAEAHRRGMAGLDTTVPDLARELERKELSPKAALAVAHALTVLDGKAAAPQLFARLPNGDTDFREVVEPALAAWKYEPARAAWLDRLAQTPTRRGTVLAVRGLLALKEEKAVPRLRELALAADGIPAVRLEAAAALAELRPTGNESDAAALAGDVSFRGITARLVAATLLRRHDGDAAVRQLQSLAKDAEPAVAERAMTRLVELDPKHAAPVLDAALASPDAGVRQLAVVGLARDPSAANVRRIGPRLEDNHPAVRTRARLALAGLAAKPELKAGVIQEGTRALGGTNWGGLQQGALLLAGLDHKPAADRLLELLTHDRPEVFVTAAWGLRVLAVPATHDPAFRTFQARLARLMTKGADLPERTVQATDEQLSQLVQLLGQGRYKPADAAFRKLIPPGTAGVETRAAAVWALGVIHEGRTKLGFERQVEARFNAVMPFDIEAPNVRRMCAVTLGRVKAEPALPSLRNGFPAGRPTIDPVSNACGWAIERITGEKYPAPGVESERQSNFFLVPLDR